MHTSRTVICSLSSATFFYFFTFLMVNISTEISAEESSATILEHLSADDVGGVVLDWTKFEESVVSSYRFWEDGKEHKVEGYKPPPAVKQSEPERFLDSSLTRAAQDMDDFEKDEFEAAMSGPTRQHEEDWEGSSERRGEGHREKRKAVGPKNKYQLLWPNGNIPYTFSPTVGGTKRQKIQSGLRQLETHSCLNYQYYSGTQLHHIKFYVRNSGCSSAIGRRTSSVGSRYVVTGINMGSTQEACTYIGTVIHETLHASGFWHEQERADRNAYIEFFTNESHDASQYTLISTTKTSVPYDYGSIMAYGANGIYERPSMVSHDPDMQFALDRRSGLTHYDLKLINEVYNCSRKQGCGGLVCYNDGYIGPGCKCVCPPYLAGARCERVSTGCGGIFDVSSQKTITSPGFGSGGYGNGIKCAWLIRSQKGRIIKMSFKQFDIEGNQASKMCKDSVEVRFVGNGMVGPRYCGQNIGRTFTSVYNNMMVILRTDANGRRNGFKAEFKVEPDIDCNSNPCQNGGTCLTNELGVSYCQCKNDYIGGRWCERVNGGWSSWSSWTSCQNGCGIQTRWRFCNSPTRRGGRDCLGSDVQQQKCGSWLCGGSFFCDMETYGLRNSDCGWYQDSQDDWDVYTGTQNELYSVSNSARDPKSAFDHTKSNSKGRYLWSGPNRNFLRKGQKARIISPLISDNQKRCFGFYYQIHGKMFIVRRYVSWSGGRQGKEYWHSGTLTPSKSTRDWDAYSTDLDPAESSVRAPYRIIIEFQRLDGDGTASVDDIYLYKGSCIEKPAPPPTRPPPVECTDENEKCTDWAGKGECSKNPSYMEVKCKKSCGLCEHRCYNNDVRCISWSEKGECEKNPTWMNVNCRKACKVCQVPVTPTPATPSARPEVPTQSPGGGSGNCDEPLLSRVPVTFSASSSHRSCPTSRALLNSRPETQGFSCQAWCSALGVRENTQDSWIQVELGNSPNDRYKVTAIAIQGRGDNDYYVKQFYLKASNNGRWWSFLKYINEGTILKFPGSYSTRRILLPEAKTSKFFRIIPISWSPFAHPCLRFELYGCKVA